MSHLKNRIMRYLLFTVLVFWLYPSQVGCQIFMGGDVKIEREPLNTIMCDVEIDIYYSTEDTSYNGHSIPVRVSSGVIDRFDWVQKSVLSKNLIQFKYEFSSVVADEPSNNVRVDTVFTFENIKNSSINPVTIVLDNAINNIGTVAVLNQDIANFESTQDAYFFDAAGALRYPLDVSESDGDQVFLEFEESLASQGFYELPPATNSIRVDNDLREFVWDKPIEPGKYLVAFRLIEVGQGFIFGTKSRYQVIEIQESDLIVNAQEASGDEVKVHLFPNPTTSTLHLQLQHAQCKRPSNYRSATLSR